MVRIIILLMFGLSCVNSFKFDMIGGNFVDINLQKQYFKHHGSLLFWQPLKNQFEHKCGCSVLSSKIVLSAAHCFDGHINVSLQDIRTRFGSLNATYGGTEKNVSKYIIHKDYNKPTKLNNDIVLLFLTNEIEFNDVIGPITLANKGALKFKVHFNILSS